ncbi:MAG: nodulation protein NfeD [Actinobacteria bacterium]|nr:nodulation protein NfeD [Actinomycetota bacterium]
MKRALLLIVAGSLLLLSNPSAAQPPPEQTVDIIRVEGAIDPPIAEYLRSRLQQAQDDGVHAAVIQIDTPGGLDVSMRDIIQEILASEVPVVVWVAPRGARAASAGTFIAYAADLTFMAESTELGAATPINIGGETPDALEKKMVNDAAAFLRELGVQQGHDPEWAEEAVREGASLGATEAAERGVVNGLASSLGDLLRAMDGETVEAGDAQVTLETWDEDAATPTVAARFQEPNLLQRLLHAVSTPDIAYLLLLIGMFGIIFELYNPGIGLGGILGGVALLLGFYAMSVLPTNWAGVLLIVLAVAFLVVDLHTAGLGIWTVGGIAALIAGALILFSGELLDVSIWVIVASVAGSLLFFISVMTAALRVRLRKPITGEEGLIGTVAEAKTDIAPEGTVVTKGTLWRARTMETGIAAGEKVQVKATEGLVLLVEPLHERPAADT